MKKLLRIALYVTATVLAGAALVGAALVVNSYRKLDRRIEIDVAAVAYTSDPAALQRGKYLYESRACSECHGADGAGRVFIDDPNGLTLSGANLTLGRGSAVLDYNEKDWVRSIRHGVKPDGRPLFVMPSEDYNRLTDGDLADLVAYVRALPPRDAQSALTRIPLVVRLAYGVGILRDAAEKIDHALPPSQPVAVGVTLEHGRYVAQSCIGCHRGKFEGGPIAGAPPQWPPAADLRGDAGPLKRYTQVDQFSSMLRSGMRPDGSRADPTMPRNVHINDVDIEALFLYLKSLDAQPQS